MITLWKANELPKNDPLSKFALPDGFPFLVVESDENIEWTSPTPVDISDL